MRIIGREGYIDLPYEQSVLYTCEHYEAGSEEDKEYLLVALTMGIDEELILNSYKTKERAEEVMSKIRSSYSINANYCYIPDE